MTTQTTMPQQDETAFPFEVFALRDEDGVPYPQMVWRGDFRDADEAGDWITNHATPAQAADHFVVTGPGMLANELRRAADTLDALRLLADDLPAELAARSRDVACRLVHQADLLDLDLDLAAE